MERRRYDDALHEFAAPCQTDPNYIKSWFHMGEVYEAKGDRDGAKRAYQGVIDNSREPNGWKRRGPEETRPAAVDESLPLIPLDSAQSFPL